MSNYAKRKEAEAIARKKETTKTIITVAIIVLVIAAIVGTIWFLKKKSSEPAKKDYGDPNYNVFDYVTLGDYEGIEVYKIIPEVTDEQVQNKIDSILNEKVEYTDLTEGDEVTEADQVVMDFSGVLAGETEPFEGGTAEDYSHTLGDGNMIPGFDEGIYGMKVGETKDIQVTFPVDYKNEDYAGKEATFTITIKSAKRASEKPEWNDAFVSEYTEGEYTTVADYEAKIREDLYNEAVESSESQLDQDIWSKIVENAKFSGYPDYLFNKTYDESYAQIQQYASMFNLTVDDYLSHFGGGIDFPTYVQRQVNNELVREALIKTLKIEIDDEELRTLVGEDLQSLFNANSYEEVIANYGKDEILAYYKSKKMNDYIREKAVITEVSQEEYNNLKNTIEQPDDADTTDDSEGNEGDGSNEDDSDDNSDGSDGE